MNDYLNTYQKLRSIGVALNGKLGRELKGYELKRAGRILGILRKDTFVFESEEESAYLFDFAINDLYDSSARNAIQKYREKHDGRFAVPEEIQLLDSLSASKPSFYKIIGTDKDKCLVHLVDDFNGDAVTIVDINFSSSPIASSLYLFSRIISIGGICMTSGAPLLFAVTQYDQVRKKFKSISKTIGLKDERTKLSATFFKIYKQIGYKSMQYS